MRLGGERGLSGSVPLSLLWRVEPATPDCAAGLAIDSRSKRWRAHSGLKALWARRFCGSPPGARERFMGSDIWATERWTACWWPVCSRHRRRALAAVVGPSAAWPPSPQRRQSSSCVGFRPLSRHPPRSRRALVGGMESSEGGNRQVEQPLTPTAEHPPPSIFSPSPAGVPDTLSGGHLAPPPPSFTGLHAKAMLSPSPAAAPPLLPLGVFSGGPIFPGPKHPSAFGALWPPAWQASGAFPRLMQGADAGLPNSAGAPATSEAADDLLRRRASVDDFYSLRRGGGRGGGGSQSSPPLGVASGPGGRGVAATMRGGGRGRGVTAAARARATAAHGGVAAPRMHGGRAGGRPPSGAATTNAAGSDVPDDMEQDGSMASPGQAAAATAAAATTTAATAAATVAARAAAAPVGAGGNSGGGPGAAAATPAGSNEEEGGSVAAVVAAAAVAASVNASTAAKLGEGAAGSTAAAAGSGGRSSAPSARARAAAEAAMLKATHLVLQLIIKELRTTGKKMTSPLSEVAAVKAVAMLVLGKAEQSALSSDAELAAVVKVGGTVDDVLKALTVGGAGPHPLTSVPAGSAGAAADGSDADVIEEPWADAIQKLFRATTFSAPRAPRPTTWWFPRPRRRAPGSSSCSPRS